jgi:hypothetical protein
MTALVRYEAARAALQAAHDVDEVKDIRDKAQAMAAYAKQAKDTKLVEWASEIKVRAERRAGAMLTEMQINGAGHANLKEGPELPEGTPGPTLDSLGISKKQSASWQKVAAIPERQFERAIEQNKQSAGVVTTAAVLRTAAQPAPRVSEARKATPAPKAEKQPDGMAKLRAAVEDLTEKNGDLVDTARELEDKLTAFEKTEPDDQQKEIMRLQKRVVKLEAEIERLTRSRNDAQAKNNELIREVKRLRKHA